MFLTADEERDLVERAQAGNRRARDRLVLTFRPLVEKEARRTFRRPTSLLDDEVQEGFVGLLKAVDKFDLSRELRFSTYLVHWIRAELYEYMLRRNAVVKGPHTNSSKRNFFGLSRAIDAARRSNPARTEEQHFEAACAALGVSVDTARAMTAVRAVSSLDVQMNGDDDRSATFVDMLADPNDAFADAEEAEEEDRRCEVFRAALAELPQRHREILEARLDRRTLDDVGFVFEISRERVRQIEQRSVELVTKSVNRKAA